MSDSTVSTASGMRSTGIISDDRTVAHGPIDRMATALASPDWVPDRGQVAWLMAQAFRWGREQGLIEAAAMTADEIATEYAVARGCAQLTARLDAMRHVRKRYDRHAAQQHDADYCGGPVPVWE